MPDLRTPGERALRVRMSLGIAMRKAGGPGLEWLDSGRVDPEWPPSPHTRWSEDHLCELASAVSRRPSSKSNTA